MREEEIRQRLLEDIEKLRAPQDYLYAGVPNFRRLFGRDSCIVGLQLLDIMPEIAKATLEILAKYQGKRVNPKKEEEPGKILHEHYVGGLNDKLKDFLQCQEKPRKIRQFIHWSFPYYGSIDSTAWFLILLSEYYKETQDQDLIRKLWPNVERALLWIENYGDLDGDSFIENQRKNPYGLFHQDWKDMLQIYIQPPIATVGAQGYYYLVYKKIGKIAEELLGDSGLKESLEKKAETLKEKFNQEFWMEGQNYFALAIDGKKEQVKIVTSNPGHCLFTGIIENDRVERVVRRLFEEDMWTPYGIRTHSLKDPDFDPRSYHQGSIWPHDNWIIYKGLQALGYQKEAKMIKTALIFAYQVLGLLPELYEVKKGKIIALKNACYLQAWSSGALLDLLKE